MPADSARHTSASFAWTGCNGPAEVIGVGGGVPLVGRDAWGSPRRRRSDLIRCFRTPFAPALACAVAFLSFAGSTAADQKIELEDLRAKVLQGDTLAYEIIASKGTLGEKSRRIDLEEPTVKIYNRQGELTDEVVGKRGRFWPETIQMPRENGTTREVTKYNWALEGDVTFRSQNGMFIETPSMHYSHDVDLIQSDEGVRYVFPTGRGSLFRGTAQRFETTMGGGGRAFKTWTLIGNVHLKTEQTE